MIGIIGAMEDEVEILKQGMEFGFTTKVCGMEFTQGNILDHEVIVTKCGVGKVNASMAATILIGYFDCDFIINTGIAGGIKGVQTEDIVLATKLMYYDVDLTVFGYEYGQLPKMPTYYLPQLDYVVAMKKALIDLGYAYKEATVYSGDCFVSDLSCLEKVDTTKACIAEMEGAAIAQTCTKSGIDFVVLRYVSDIVGEKDQIKDYMSFEKAMSERSAQICLEVIKKIS